ncbi:MAG: hypothetical protein Tsb0013_12690 [Phycisphaerales bacterium]
MILTQTRAIFVDAFRELNARKLFWITLGLSLLVVLVFAMLGIDPNKGLTFAIWTIPGYEEFAKRVPADLFYRFWMISIGVNVWLAWVATIIALISTAGIVPAMVTSGAIDTMLSKPIGRVRLFLTKYVTGLLFVVLQVGVFVVGCILVIGLRAGDWEWGLLWAIPLVTLFFSYLFSISALVGLISKSPLTAVLVTALVWFLIFLVNLADGIMLQIRSQFEFQRDMAQVQLSYQPEQIEQLEALLAEEEAAGEAEDSRTARRLERARERLADAESDLQEAQDNIDGVSTWYGYTFMLKTTLPKTGETVALIERWLIDTSELADVFPDQFGAQQVDPDGGDGGGEDSLPSTPSEVVPAEMRVQQAIRSRSTLWVIGTSVVFEVLILGVACLIFARRDF